MWCGLGRCVVIAVAALAACAGPSQAVKTPAAAAPAAPLELMRPGGSDGAQLSQAVELMDAGKLAEATALLEDLHRRLPDNVVVLHELGLSHRLARQPARAVALLMPYRDRLPPQMLSGLGSALDEAGDTKQAEAVLREGIARFPHAGVLFADLGTTLQAAGRREEALGLYTQGMDAEPAFPGNYFRAARLLAASDHRGLALVYGEMFRLMEPRSERSAEAGRIMVQVCVDAVHVDRRGKKVEATTSLGPKTVVVRPEEIGKKPLVPLATMFEIAFGPGLVAAHAKGLTLASLHEARRAFVDRLRQPESTFMNYGIPLFPWLAELDAAGHLEAYDVWLYGDAFPDEQRRWTAAHGDELARMASYLLQHPLFP